MSRNIDLGLSQLTRQLLLMGGYVEKAVEAATEAWRTRNIDKTKEVYAAEAKVNAAHKEIDASCVKLLALQQPLAVDLRFIVSCIKINTDLERMTDLAVNIANNTEFYLRSSQQVPVNDLSEMSDKVRVMLREVLDALVKTDEKIARRVLQLDDQVDSFKRKIFDDCLVVMKKNPQMIDQGLNVILIARNLERIGDHATNIAEDIIFTVSGVDVRHTFEEKK